MSEFESANRWGTDPLIFRLQLLLASPNHPPVFDAAIAAIREFQADAESCNLSDDDDIYIGQIFPPRIANKIEQRFRILFLADLEKVPVEDLASIVNLGTKAIEEIAAALRDNFPRVDADAVEMGDDSSVENCGQWYWAMSDNDIRLLALAATEQTRMQVKSASDLLADG